MKKRMIFTTSWDDGDKLDLKLLDLMNKYGIKGTFYIPGNCKLTNSEIKKISKTQELGAHTMNHKELDSISLKEARKEIKESKDFLEKCIKKKIYSFSYPRGKFNIAVAKIVDEEGFKYGRTTERFCFSLSKNPQLNGVSAQTIIFKADIFKVLKINWHNPFFIRYIFDWDYFMKILLNDVQKKGGIIHLWGHSWEIEKFDQWKMLERFFKFISNVNGIEFKTNYELIKHG